MAQNSINILITAKDAASATLKRISQEVDSGTGSIDRANQRWAQLGNVVKVSALALAAAGVSAATYAVKTAADYEQSLNVFQSVSGATVEQMKLVGAQARALGQDAALPGISARDAAAAMVELSKAGISVNDTLKASKGVLALAKAGNIETAEAASIAANALNAFSLKGEEATRVADLLAAGANASSADVRDMAYSLQMSAAQAASVKVPVEDLTTAIAEMANNGIVGSDAGTSLKTMFMNLIPTTDKAKESMKKLNLDFYDAEGRFVGMRNLVEQLQKGTAGLTDEQKALHIEQIFGADSSRAVNILMKEGVQGYDKLRTSVTKAGAATELARAQNAGFKGALDNLQSSLETVSIDVGSRLLPKLTSLIQTVGPRLTSSFSTAANGTVDFMENLSRLTGLLPGAAAAFIVYNVVAGASTVATMALVAAQTALNFVLGLNPIALVAAATIGLVVAYTQIVGSSDSAASATQRLGLARENLEVKTRAAKAAEDDLKNAQLSSEESALRVERAQRTYTDAVEQYGPRSLEAREAELQLKRARDDNANATENLKNKTNEAKTANDELAKAKDIVVKANDAMKDSANRAADGFTAFANAAKEANKATSTGQTSKANQVVIDSLKMPGHASGTPYAPGGLTMVGERGPELVNLPRGSQVTQAWKTREMGTQGGGGDINVNIYGSITNQTPEAANAFWDRVDATTRRARRGMAGAAA